MPKIGPIRDKLKKEPYRGLSDYRSGDHSSVIDLEAGDKVAFSAKFLKGIGVYTGDLPAARGRLTKLKIVGDQCLAWVEWEKESPGVRSGWSHTSNLAKVGPNLRFCSE